MSGDGLWLSVHPYEPEVVELEVVARSHGFAGRGRAYFDVDTLRGFADALGEFPLGAAARRGIEGGYGAPGRLEQVHVGISAYAIGVLGRIGLAIRLATPLWPQDRPESQHRVQLEVELTYSSLARGVEALRRLLDGTVRVAAILADDAT